MTGQRPDVSLKTSSGVTQKLKHYLEQWSVAWKLSQVAALPLPPTP